MKISSKVHQAFHRLKRRGDYAVIARQYGVKQSDVRQAMSKGYGNTNVVNALVEFYFSVKRQREKEIASIQIKQNSLTESR